MSNSNEARTEKQRVNSTEGSHKKVTETSDS